MGHFPQGKVSGNLHHKPNRVHNWLNYNARPRLPYLLAHARESGLSLHCILVAEKGTRTCQSKNGAALGELCSTCTYMQ